MLLPCKFLIFLCNMCSDLAYYHVSAEKYVHSFLTNDQIHLKQQVYLRGILAAVIEIILRYSSCIKALEVFEPSRTFGNELCLGCPELDFFVLFRAERPIITSRCGF